MRRLMLVCLVTGLALGLTSVSIADDIEWDNGSGDTLWQTVENWVGDVAPGAGDDVVIKPPAGSGANSPRMIGQNVSIHGLWTEGAGGTADLLVQDSTLTVGDWIWWGDEDGSGGGPTVTSTMDVVNSTLTAEELELGWARSTGYMNVSGNSNITVGDLRIPVGVELWNEAHAGALGFLTIKSGTVNVTVPQDPADNWEGLSISMDPASPGYVDIYAGEMRIAGDVVDYVQERIDAFQVLGYGGMGTAMVEYLGPQGEDITRVWAIPEPATLSLFASLVLALGGAGLLRRRRA